MEKTIRISVYKILRKLGVNKALINPNASLFDEIITHELEKLLFFFMLETRFNITIRRNDEQQIETLEDAICIVSKHVQ